MLEQNNKMTLIQGFKYLLLGFITAAGIWVAGLNVGDMSSSMLGEFDKYNPKSEATWNGNEDTKGTALFIDLGIHLAGTYMTMAAVSSIIAYALQTLNEWA